MYHQKRDLRFKDKLRNIITRIKKEIGIFINYPTHRLDSSISRDPILSQRNDWSYTIKSSYPL